MSNDNDYSIVRSPSSIHRNRTNIIVSGPSFAECQNGVFAVMDEVTRASFTLPVRTANGEYVAIGHSTHYGDDHAENPDR